MAIDINIATPTLDEVTTSGNTTTNEIQFGTGVGILLDNTSRLREGTIDAQTGGSKGIAQICAVGYELKWEAGSQYVMDGNGTLIREVNHKFNIIPDLNNDSTEGFYVGSRWILDNGDVYVCTDSTATNAVWEKLNSLDELVPYTGATADVNLGNQDLYANKVWLYDAPNDAHGSIHLTDNDFHIEDSDGHKMLVIEDGFMQIHLTDAIQSNLYTSGLTDIRDHYLPDASGTIALTSNIPAVDSVPTDASANAVSSNGVFDALANKVDKNTAIVGATKTKITYDAKGLVTAGADATKSDVGLANVDNTSDTNKPVSTATQTALNAKQDTLVSATNIKTINGTTLLGSGDIAISTGLTIGTTPITSGTVGRILFQGAGNVTQQDSNLFWDNTNKRLGIGATPSTSVRLDVRAQGALSTDIAFRVRNSADTQNILSLTGDGRIAIGLNAQILGTTSNANRNVVIGASALDIASAGVSENSVAIGYNAVSNNGGLALGANTQITGSNGVAVGVSAIAGIDSIAVGSASRADGTSGYQSLAIGKGARASALLSGIIAVGQSSYTNALAQTLAFCVDPSGANSQTMLLTNKANLVFKNSAQLTASTHWNTTATNTLTIHNGTIPNGNIVDAIQFYSADIVAGNTAPHFRTENGSIIKIYQETTAVTSSAFIVGIGTAVTDASTFDGYTISQITKALRNLGILA